MIPKKIHYCWFGGNPLPQDALMCIESWKKYFPDYEIIEWNEKNFDKKPEKAHLFVPFADTVVAFDYVLGQEQQCADTIAAFIEAFSDSPYKLRIVLLERHQRASEYDWLMVLS